jgi:hypothetical protein
MKRLIFLALPLLILAGPAVQAKKIAAAAPAKKTAPADLKWMDGPPGLPGGATFAVVSGDPNKKGMFTVQIRMPANYAVRPHWHPTDENVTLVSGKLAYGMSDQLDRASAQSMNTSDKIVMKAKVHHWVFTGDGAEIQLSAMGPFLITYVDPADDPRGASKAPKKP